MKYNPISIFGVKPTPERTELKLLVKSRYCDIDFSKSVAYFYIELTDNINSYIIPCKYYEFLAAADADYVFCTYIKLKQGKGLLNVLELSRIPKTHINIEGYNDKLNVNPLSNNNKTIPKEYVLVSKEFVNITRVIQKQSDILCVGLATATLQSGVYVSALCSVETLFNLSDIYMKYRKIKINNKEILVDMEVCTL